MPTRLIGSYEDDQVRVELDYNAQDRITGIRVINNATVNVYVEAQQISNGRKYGALFLAGTTTVIPISTAVATRIEQFLNARGKWDGLEIRVLIPAP